MLRKLSFFAAAILTMAAALVSPHEAEASEWGCEVLLCAASSNPSWKSIPFCHAPMYKLIACRSKTFGACSWPKCTQAGTGAPGYQAYEACPAGWTPSSSNSGNNNGISIGGSSQLNQCSRRVANPNCLWGERDCEPFRTETRPRPRKADPYFFNIKDDTTGEVGTHWFNLNK